MASCDGAHRDEHALFVRALRHLVEQLPQVRH